MRFIRLSLAHTLYHLRAFLRSTRTVVLGLVMPVGLLVVLNWVFANQGEMTGISGNQISAIAFYTGSLTACGLMLGTFTGVMVTSVSAREAGWLKRVRGSPMPPGSYLAGQVLFNTTVSLLLTGVMIAVAALAYGLPLRLVPVLAVLCYALLGVFCFTAVALALSKVITTPEMASSLGPFTTIILSFMSGVFFPPNLMPHWLVAFSNYLPLEPLAQSMQSALALQRGTGFELRTVVVLGIWIVTGFAVARRTFTWQPLRR
jgi:ABC-2 type transport system permease protein